MSYGIGSVEGFAVSAVDTLGAAPAAVTPDPVVFRDGTVSHPLTWIEWYKEDSVNGVPASANVAYAEVDLNDRDVYYKGYKAPLVLNWARITRGLSDRQGQVEHLSFGATFSDADRRFRGFLDDAANTRYLTNRPLIERMIDDEDRRIEGVPRVVANGFLTDYSPIGGLQFGVSGSDFIKRKFTRSRRSQLKWQPLVLVNDFDPNTTPADVLNRPAPVIYGSSGTNDEDLQTVADSSRVTGYLPDPTAGSPTLTGSPANAVTKRFYFTAMNGFYGDPAIQKSSDHRGETYCDSVDQSVPDDQELRDQVNAGTASVYCTFPVTADTAAVAVRVYAGDTDGANVKYLGLADDLGGGSFSFTYGKSSTSGGPLYPAGEDALVPLRNNTYIPGTLTGGNVTTDTGSGKVQPIYTGLRLCLDGVHRAEFLIAAHACKSVVAVYLGGVRVPDSELDDYFTVQGRASWLTAWTPFTRQYFEVNGRRYCTILVDRQYAKDRKLVAVNELSAGETPLTVNVEGIETVGDATGTLITRLVLQAQHFAENMLAADRPINAQAWVNAFPLFFAAIPELTYVDRASFAAVDALVAMDGGGVIGYGGEEVGALDVLARFCVSGDFEVGLSRLGQLIASYEPTSVPGAPEVLDDVLNITENSLTIRDQVTSQFFNILPYRWGQDYSGRTSGGEAFVRGLRLVLPSAGGWASIAAGETELRDDDSIVNYDQEIAAPQRDLFFIHDTVSAAAVLQRVLDRYKNPLRTAVLTVPLSGTNVDLGDVFEVTAVEGISSTGWTGRALRCTRHELDPNTNTVTIEAYDFQRVLDAAA